MRERTAGHTHSTYMHTYITQHRHRHEERKTSGVSALDTGTIEHLKARPPRLLSQVPPGHSVLGWDGPSLLLLLRHSKSRAESGQALGAKWKLKDSKSAPGWHYDPHNCARTGQAGVGQGRTAHGPSKATVPLPLSQSRTPLSGPMINTIPWWLSHFTFSAVPGPHVGSSRWCWGSEQRSGGRRRPRKMSLWGWMTQNRSPTHLRGDTQTGKPRSSLSL